MSVTDTTAKTAAGSAAQTAANTADAAGETTAVETGAVESTFLEATAVESAADADTETSAPGSSAAAPSAGAELDEFGGVIGAGQVRTIRAPWGADSVARVRRALVQDLEARGIDPDTIDESEIVASELVSNAFKHAKPLHDGTVRLRWRVRGEVVEVEVTDGGGDTTPRPFPQALWASSGRGLRIVRSLSHEWGVADDKTGITVWAAMGGPSRRRAG
ncbi:MAG TPA: ATP-binding protein [Dermatophilaceae bacterium]|nr:ATP-binding protein [Dermatophilaceae bacterium]